MEWYAVFEDLAGELHVLSGVGCYKCNRDGVQEGHHACGGGVSQNLIDRGIVWLTYQMKPPEGYRHSSLAIFEKYGSLVVRMKG